jgi:hypothetical protein
MKTKTKQKKEISLISELRKIRDKVSMDIKDFTSKELKEFLNSKKKSSSVVKKRNVKV